MNEYYGNNDYRDYIAHYGVKGMKWGKHLFGDLYDKVTGGRGYEYNRLRNRQTQNAKMAAHARNTAASMRMANRGIAPSNKIGGYSNGAISFVRNVAYNRQKDANIYKSFADNTFEGKVENALKRAQKQVSKGKKVISNIISKISKSAKKSYSSISSGVSKTFKKGKRSVSKFLDNVTGAKKRRTAANKSTVRQRQSAYRDRQRARTTGDGVKRSGVTLYEKRIPEKKIYEKRIKEKTWMNSTTDWSNKNVKRWR